MTALAHIQPASPEAWARAVLSDGQSSEKDRATALYLLGEAATPVPPQPRSVHPALALPWLGLLMLDAAFNITEGRKPR